MKKFPHECPTCGERRDSHDASFKDWEEARRPLEEKIKELEDEVARQNHIILLYTYF